MPAKPKRSPKDKARAVERYMAKQSGVKELAKEYGVSEPAIYQWIQAAKVQAAESARTAHFSPNQVAQDSRINKDLHIKQLEKENRELKSKLFELMLKHDEI